MARQERPNAGFTIIELLIVIAIGGLIFLIIFSAIPALLRNARNNQRKQDVAAVLSAVSQYQLNHSGTFPSQVAEDNDDYYLKYTDLSFYDKPDVKVNHMTAGAGGQTQSNGSKIDVYNYNVCIADAGAGKVTTSDAAGYRDIVAVYRIETSSGTVPKCQQL